MISNTDPIVVQCELQAPTNVVWKALTVNDHMKQWYFQLPNFKAEVGFKFQFLGGKDEENQFLHHCEIIEVIDQKKLSYSWRFDGFPGISYVHFELEDHGDSTLVTITHDAIESFEPFHVDFAKANFLEGWTSILDTSLRNFVEKKS
ncbi:MAG: SRPBCC domain-containing protein [Saprospiraceae bacterium]